MRMSIETENNRKQKALRPSGETQPTFFIFGVFARCIRCYKLFFFLLTFVLQSETSSRHANVGEKVEVELVGSTVEESWNRGALGRRLIVDFSNPI